MNDFNKNRRNNSYNYEYDLTGEVMHWVIIIISFIAFFPLGLYLLWRKEKANLRKTADNWRSQKNFDDAAFKEAKDEAADAINELKNEAINVATEVKAELQDIFTMFVDGDSPSRKSAREASRRAQSSRGSESAQSFQSNENARSVQNAQSFRSNENARSAQSAQSAQNANNIKNVKSVKSSIGKKQRALPIILVFVGIGLIVLGLSNFIMSLVDVLQGTAQWPELLIGAFWTAGGFSVLIAYRVISARLSRYNELFMMISGRDMVLVADLCRSAGMSEKALKRDIRAMIEKGMLGKSAYFDYGLNCIVLTPAAAAAAREATAKATQVSSVDSPVGDGGGESARSQSEQFSSILSEIRELNDAIADERISAKVDKIEQTTEKIFLQVEEEPSKRPRIDRFLSYYIPTTKKFLRSYAILEKQGIKSDNILKAKEKIGKTLDTLAEGFEQQLDKLFEAEVMDIAAEITVLENLMKQDGLSSDDDGIKLV